MITTDKNDKTIDLLLLSKSEHLKTGKSIQSKIEPSDIVPHITVDLPFQKKNYDKDVVKAIKNLVGKLEKIYEQDSKYEHGKKLKNKTFRHHRLGYNFTYSIESLPFFTKFDPSKKIYIYLIDVSDYSGQCLGFLLNSDIPIRIKFHLINKVTTESNYITIKNNSTISITKEEFSLIEKYNQVINLDIFNNSFDFMKNPIVPIIYDSLFGTTQINYAMINQAINKKEAPSITIHSADFNRDKLFITKHKSNSQFYQFFDVVNYNDTIDCFLNKVCSHDEKYKKEIIKQFFPGLNRSSFAGDFISMKLYTGLNAITNYRAYVEKNLPKDYVPETPYFFYVDAPKVHNDATIISKLQTPAQQRSRSFIHLLYPIDELRYYFLDKKELYIFSSLQYILNTFERFLYPYYFILEIFPDFAKYLTDDNYKYFLWALTPPSMLLSYSYETIETLGDSILKFILTSHLYFHNEKTCKSEGTVEKERVGYIKNRYLFEKGKDIQIYKYVITKSNSMNNNISMELSEKTMADIIESTIAAFYLTKKDISDALVFISKCKICENGVVANDTEETRKKLSGYTSFSFGTVEEDDFGFLKYGISFKEVAEHYNIADYLNNDYDNIQPCWEKLEELLGYKFNDKEYLERAVRHISVNRKDNYEKMELLGDSIVEVYVILHVYDIYTKFLYHYDKPERPTEEISRTLYDKAEKFDSFKATKIKSFLCSNNFMCKISYLLTLPYYLQYDEKGKKEISCQIENFLSKSNIDIILNRKFDCYEEPESFNPKIVADLLEAMVGAIYLDGGLVSALKFLNRIYGPFVLYCILHFENLKYSAINDFTLHCTNHYKTAPGYELKYCEGRYIIDILIMGKKMFSGEGSTQEAAKAVAAINGLKELKKKYE